MSQVAAHARRTTPGAFGRHPLPRKGAGETAGGSKVHNKNLISRKEPPCWKQQGGLFIPRMQRAYMR